MACLHATSCVTKLASTGTARGEEMEVPLTEHTLPEQDLLDVGAVPPEDHLLHRTSAGPRCQRGNHAADAKQ
jgi:hypothetical protein